MRVTAQTKVITRKKILDAAQRLFAEKGYDATATRDIARAAKIASGTVFNYFPTKEAILTCLAADAMAEALADSQSHNHNAQTLEEGLFALVAAGLRKMKPLRRHLPALLETSLNPLALATDEAPQSLRSAHLEAVAATAAAHGQGELSATALQIYWTLYTGVLVFWANDSSAKQEETLALIDDSLNMFVGWLREQSNANSTSSER